MIATVAVVTEEQLVLKQNCWRWGGREEERERENVDYSIAEVGTKAYVNQYCTLLNIALTISTYGT